MKMSPGKALIVTLVVCCSVLFSLRHFVRVAGLYHAPPTLEQKATHRITFLDDGRKVDGYCTATAIGPHTILTAEHCNDGPMPDSVLRLDYSSRKRNILHTELDGRDHLIYVIDGPEFKNYVPFEGKSAGVAVGSEVHSYVTGDDLPPKELRGRKLLFYDISEADEAEHMGQYDLPVVPGDSGSAVYSSDGKIIAVVFYQRQDDRFEYQHFTTIASEQNFTEDQMAKVKQFDPGIAGQVNK